MIHGYLWFSVLFVAWSVTVFLAGFRSGFERGARASAKRIIGDAVERMRKQERSPRQALGPTAGAIEL